MASVRIRLGSRASRFIRRWGWVARVLGTSFLFPLSCSCGEGGELFANADADVDTAGTAVMFGWIRRAFFLLIIVISVRIRGEGEGSLGV